jgi:hypothetical protein
MANSLVQWWRDQNPGDAGLPDQDVTLKIADLAPAYKAQGRDIFTEFPDFAADYDAITQSMRRENRREFSTLGNEISRGVERGYEGLKSTITGAAALAADAIPGKFADPVRDALISKYRKQQEAASADDVVAAVPSYKDVESVGDAAKYVAGLAGEAVPSIAESVATGIAGAAIGTAAEPGGGTVVGGVAGLVAKQAAKRLIAKKVAGFTAKEIEEAALKGVGSEALKTLVKAETKALMSGAGAAIAGAINSYGLSAGEIYGELATNPNVDPEDAFKVALTAAVPAAALDTVLPTYVIGKSGVLSRLAGAVENFGETERRGFLGYVTRLAAEIPKTATLEGGTEAFQEMVNIAAEKYAETKTFGEFTTGDWERVANAAAGGAAGGFVAAPAASVRMAPEATNRASADAGGEKKDEAAKTEEKKPEAESTQADPSPTIGQEILQENFDVNVEGIVDLAKRKLAGEDVLAEEEALKKYPDAVRRYQAEVIKQSEAKLAAASKAATDASEAAAPAAPTAEQNPSSPPTEVSLPADAGAAPGGGVPAAAPAQPSTQPKPDIANPISEPDASAEPEPPKVDEKVAAAVEARTKRAQAKIGKIQSEMAALEKEASDARAKVTEAQAALARYEKADQKGRAAMADEMKKYGGPAGIADFIKNASILRKDEKTGKPKLTLNGRRDGRGGVAAKLASMAKLMEKEELGLKRAASSQAITSDDVNLDVGSTDADDQEEGVDSGKPTDPPGYYDIADESEFGQDLKALVEQVKSKGAGSAAAVVRLGGMLTSRAHDKRSGSATSYRVTAWVGPDGKVTLSTSHRRSGGDFITPNQVYRFAVKDGPATIKGASMGIVEMIDAGYTPHASMLLSSDRDHGAQFFGSVEEFDAKFGSLKQARDAVSTVENETATSDGGSVIVDTNQKDASVELDDAEFALANQLLQAAVSDALQSGIPAVVEGRFNPAFFKDTLAGRMISRHQQIENAIKEEKPISANIGAEFIDDLVKLAEAADIELGGGDVTAIVKTMPDAIGQLADRFQSGLRLAKQKQEKSKNENTEGAPAVGGKSDAGSAASSAGNGGDVGEGDRSIAQETGPGPAQAAAPAAGGAGQAEGASPGGDVTSAQVQADRDLKKVSDSTVEAFEERAAELLDDGVITDDEHDEALDRVYDLIKGDPKDYQGIIDLVKELNEEFRELEAERKSNTRSRMAQEDVDAVDTVSLADGRLIAPELSPTSIQAIIHNIMRLMRPKPQNLSAPLSAADLRTKYPDLRSALRRIAIASASDGTPAGAIRAAAAKAMMDQGNSAGVTMIIGDNPDVPGQLGKYDLRSDTITVFAAGHTNEDDLQSTILEEALHAFTAKARVAFSKAPESLNESTRDAISGIESMMKLARDNGMTWQQSDGSPEVAFDEFVAAVIRDRGFQDRLQTIGVSRDFGVAKATNLFEAIVQYIGRIVASLVERFSELFGINGPTKRTALDASVSMVKQLIEAHQRIAPSGGLVEGERARKVDGTVGTGGEITVDSSSFAADATAEAKRLMALQNQIADAMIDMINSWNSKGNNRSSAGVQLLNDDQAIRRMILDVVSSTSPLPSEAKIAINTALTDQGAAPVLETIGIGDLESLSDAPKVAKQALNALYSIRQKLGAELEIARDLFGKRNILSAIASASFELTELTKKYEDMTFIGKELVKEVRRSINESEDRGAGSIAKAMGLSQGRKASLAAAETWVRGNLPQFTDAVTALAELGLDPKLTPPADILRDVIAATPGKPALAPLNDVGRLSMALQFARRRPMVMQLLATRGKGEAGALRSIINQAMSDRPDAIALAKRDLSKLTKVGHIAGRIIDEIETKRRQHRAMLDRAKVMAEREQFIIDTNQALNRRIGKLEQLLQLESTGINGGEWTAHAGAVYRVPTSPNQSAGELFSAAQGSPEYRVLSLGFDFDGAKVRQDMAAMKAWLDANPDLQGTANYTMMVRQVDALARVYSRELDANVKRGPSGLVIRVLGSTADRLDQIGLRGAKEAARMTRQFVAGFEQSLRSVDAKRFHEFDALMRQGVQITKLHPREFKRLYYNRALGYLESRQDLLNPGIPTEQQTANLIDEAVKFLNSQDQMSSQLEEVVRLLLGTTADNGQIITRENRRNFGLKVRDVMKGGRVYLREIIGSPLSTAARGIHEDVRAWVGRAKAAWSTPYDVAGSKETKLRGEPISLLYTTDRAALEAIIKTRFTDEVVTRFLKPLAYKTGMTNFAGPEILGVSDMASRKNLIEAYSRSSGDVLRFIEELHALEGGSPADLPTFVGSTLATLQSYMSTLESITDAAGQPLDDDADPGLNFLNARQGEDFPWEWLDYKEYGFQQRTRYLRVMAQQAAFGDGSSSFSAALAEAKKQLESLREEYERANAMLTAGNKAGAEALMNKDGLRTARSNAAANLVELQRVASRHADMMRTLNGGPSGLRAFSELLGVISGMTVQGFATAATDSVTLIEAPFRKFGFTKEALQFITGTWRALGTEVWGTFAQAFGMDMHTDAATEAETRLLNRMGLADLDSLSNQRGFKALHERYIEELSDELSFSAIATRYQNERIRMATQMAGAAVSRVAKGAKVFLEAGIGVADEAETGFATLKLLNPFSQGSIWMHRAAARQWLRTVNNAILKAEAYFRAHPQHEADPNFRFTAKELGYTGKTLTGMKLDNRAWEFLAEKLAQSGISLEEAARRKMRGADPLTFSQTQSALSLAQTEILLNSSPTTRPAWAMTPGGKLITPLIGWSLYKTADLVKTAGDPQYRRDGKSFVAFMEAMMFGVLPVALVYAVLRDEYEEDVLKKKQNVMPLRADATLPAAVLDATSRMGVFGVLGEIPNTIVNQATAREVSIDSRVFAVSSLISLMKVATTAYNQDFTMTYATTMRPFLQAVGGSGYLQNFDALNGLAGLDNIESRMARRINVGNHLRVAGRMNGLEVRTSRGSTVTANPVRPHVVNMALAAYANDASGFRDSYEKALQAAIKEYPGSDPYEKVASSYEAMHPLKSVFAARPSSAEYQKMLRTLGPEGPEVATAIRNFNAYGQQVLTKRGGSGIKPFNGTETPASKVDYRTLLTR